MMITMFYENKKGTHCMERNPSRDRIIKLVTGKGNAKWVRVEDDNGEIVAERTKNDDGRFDQLRRNEYWWFYDDDVGVDHYEGI